MHTLVVAPVDPLTFWIPACAVVIAAFINVATVIVATRLAGSNSDRSLARTIEADRRGRVLERQLDLYGEILNFVSKRKQKRDEVTALVKMDGISVLDPFDPLELWKLIGRAEAVAHTSVLTAFLAANQMDSKVINQYNWIHIPALASAVNAESYTKLDGYKVEANRLDEQLTRAVRLALHRGDIPVFDEADDHNQQHTEVAATS